MHGPDGRPCPAGVAAPGAILLCSAGAPAVARRGIRPLARPVPRPAPDRTGEAHAYGTACADLGVRCLKRDRPGRPPRSARARSTPAGPGRSAREGASSDGNGLAGADPASPKGDGGLLPTLQTVAERPARAGQNPRGTRGRARRRRTEMIVRGLTFRMGEGAREAPVRAAAS